MDRKIYFVFVVVVIMTMLTACGVAAPTPTAKIVEVTRVVPTTVPLVRVGVQLGWQNNGEFAAVHNAIAEGFYRAEGLEVTIKTGGSGIDPLPIVANRNEIFGVSAGTSQIVAAVANSKIPIKAVAALGQTIPSGYMYYLNEGEQPGKRTPKDWKGKVVCTQKTGFIPARLIAGIVGLGEKDFTLVEAGDAPDMLQAGKCDYFNGWSTNQGFVLDNAGKPWSMMFASDYVPAYADVIFVRTDYLQNNPEIVRKFVRASMRGLQFQIDNPAKTVENVLKYGQEGLNKDQLTWRMTKQNPLAASADTKTNGLGWMDAKKWKTLADNMVTTGEIKVAPAAADMMTNDFLK